MQAAHSTSARYKIQPDRYQKGKSQGWHLTACVLMWDTVLEPNFDPMSYILGESFGEETVTML